MAVKEINGLLFVESGAIDEFLKDLQSSIQAGYVLVLDSVQYYPRIMHTPFYAVLKKATSEDLDKLEQEIQEASPKARTRTKKEV